MPRYPFTDKRRKKFSPINPNTIEPINLADRIRKAIMQNPTKPLVQIASELKTTPKKISRIKSKMRKAGYYLPNIQQKNLSYINPETMEPAIKTHRIKKALLQGASPEEIMKKENTTMQTIKRLQYEIKSWKTTNKTAKKRTLFSQI